MRRTKKYETSRIWGFHMFWVLCRGAVIRAPHHSRQFKDENERRRKNDSTLMN